MRTIPTLASVVFIILTQDAYYSSIQKSGKLSMDKYNWKTSRDAFALFKKIWENGTISLTDLHILTKKSKSVLCDQLRVLKNHNFITDVQWGKQKIYTVDKNNLSKLFKTTNKADQYAILITHTNFKEALETTNLKDTFIPFEFWNDVEKMLSHEIDNSPNITIGLPKNASTESLKKLIEKERENFKILIEKLKKGEN